MFQRYIIRPLDHLGSVLILTVRIVIAIVSTQGFFKKVIDQCYLLGIRSFFCYCCYCNVYWNGIYVTNY